MSDKITLRGTVGTPPRTVKTTENLVITSFRLASSLRRYDRSQDKWVETDTNWYTITAFRQLATNTFASVVKGDRVVVTGALKLREWKSGDRSGTTAEVEAESIGHDLVFGTGTFVRSGQSVYGLEADTSSGDELGGRTEEYPVSRALEEATGDVTAADPDDRAQPAPGGWATATQGAASPFGDVA